MKLYILAASLMAATLFSFAPCCASDAAAPAKPNLPSALSSADLADLSGGASPTGVAINNQTLTAVNSGNSVEAAGNVVTGNVAIDAGAFSGFNGVGNFVFNTGNNNNLQGSLSITIVTPGTN